MALETKESIPGYKKLVPSKGYIKAFELFELSRCRHCGRVLHSEKSQKAGIGPGCAQQVGMMYVTQKVPHYVGDKVKQKWTREEINALLQKAKVNT